MYLEARPSPEVRYALNVQAGRRNEFDRACQKHSFSSSVCDSISTLWVSQHLFSEADRFLVFLVEGHMFAVVKTMRLGSPAWIIQTSFLEHFMHVI